MGYNPLSSFGKRLAALVIEALYIGVRFDSNGSRYLMNLISIIYKSVLQDIDIKLLYSFLSLPTSFLLTYDVT